MLKTIHSQQLKGMQRSNLGVRKGYHLSIEGIQKGYLFCLKSWFVQLQTNSFQGRYKHFSRTNYGFQGL